MLNFLLQRPIAVLMSFLAAVIFSLLAFWHLPVSLLPEVEVPRMLVKVHYPGASPAQLEEDVLRPIRENILTLSGLEELQSQARSEQGLLEIRFAYGTNMSLAYIEMNERIDRLSEQLPREMPRPQVVRISTSDIPVVRLQVLLKDSGDYVAVSKLTEKVLRKRLEQLEGVSLVDINGLREEVVSIRPDEAKLAAFGLSAADLAEAVRSSNQQIGGIALKDGHYTYYIKAGSQLQTAADVGDVSLLTKGGMLVRLNQLAMVQQETGRISGYHLFAEKGDALQKGLVVTIHKQALARMPELMPKIEAAVALFRSDYPQVGFRLTQDQSALLRAGIDNLTSSLLWGGLFAFAVLFLFMADYRTPLIIGLSLPVSLLLSFSVFWLFDISINIISLSGLALGLGMLIDNAIIVLDNISRKQAAGFSLVEACAKGAQEVMAPLISSVLTTLAVFVPLIYLNGLSGALFYDQALSVAAILSVSLLVSFVLLPLLYKLFFKEGKETAGADSRLYLGILKNYKCLFRVIWQNRKLSYTFLLLLLPAALLLGLLLEQRGLPELEKREQLLQISWNEPLEVEGNRSRVAQLLQELKGSFELAEGDVGLQEYLLQQEENALDEALLYFKFQDIAQKAAAGKKLTTYLENHYPNARWKLKDAPNAFDQLFSSSQPYLEVQLSDFSGGKPMPPTKLRDLQAKLEQQSGSHFLAGAGTEQETAVRLSIDFDRLEQYKISYEELKERLQQLFSDSRIDELKSFGTSQLILFKEPAADFNTKLSSARLRNREGIEYPLQAFISHHFVQDYKTIVAGKNGIYQGMILGEQADVEKITPQIRKAVLAAQTNVNFAGQYFQDQENLRQLTLILFISVALLYFILAAQFESLLQPFIILLTLPLGIGGSLLLLWLSGNSLNIMSVIGIIVALGIMVNDAILKVDTINRLRKELLKEGIAAKEALAQAIAKAGALRLKPILMTSITTILALLPVLFSSGLGADLQKPLVLSVIGGLTIGTATAVYFVPLAYFYLAGKKSYHVV
jgi:multidrug efflux pump subunit AcrB